LRLERSQYRGQGHKISISRSRSQVEVMRSRSLGHIVEVMRLRSQGHDIEVMVMMLSSRGQGHKARSQGQGHKVSIFSPGKHWTWYWT